MDLRRPTAVTLAAALRALTTQADDDACNEGFRRPDVPLALIFLADENDGSLDPTHPELLDPDRADLGPLSIRSALHPELLRDVAELAAGFRALTVSFPSLVPPICVHLCPSVVSPLPLPLLSPTPFATTRSPMPAATLLNRIRRARRDGPTLAVIRHAARHEIAAADMEEAYRTPLTDAGRSASAALGALLPSDLRLVCFHSPVPRCADTAALVAEGFRAAGGTARDGGDLDALGAEYVRDASVVLRSFAARGRRPFVRDWCTGALGPDLIQEPCAAGRHVLQTLLDLRSAAPADELHLHVTHDLTLITLLALISDPTAPRFPWPPFLDGVVLSLQADRVIWRRTSRVIATDRDGRRRD